MPIILGIESTAHTFGVAIVKNKKILANVKKSYTTEKGGIIPMEAAKHHTGYKEQVYREALEKSKIREGDIDAIAISQGPGLSPCLLIGMGFAKELASKLKIPIVPVNHCIAHLEIGRLTGAKDPVMLYASGANTQIIAYASGKFRVFGETLDIGIGNFIDTFARYAGLGFPGGPKIESLASKTNQKSLVELPYSIKGMDIALSGILTNLKQKLESKKYSLNDLAFSLQETAFAELVETAERALAHTGKKELLLGGGVSCNKRLKEMCRIMCRERGALFFVPENQFLVDNAGMIAFLGEIIYNSQKHSHHSTLKNVNRKKRGDKIGGYKIYPNLIYYPNQLKNLDIKPRQRTDDVEVSWR